MTTPIVPLAVPAEVAVRLNALKSCAEEIERVVPGSLLNLRLATQRRLVLGEAIDLRPLDRVLDAAARLREALDAVRCDVAREAER